MITIKHTMYSYCFDRKEKGTYSNIRKYKRQAIFFFYNKYSILPTVVKEKIIPLENDKGISKDFPNLDALFTLDFCETQTCI